MSLQSDLQAAVAKASAASAKLHAIVNGDTSASVDTENGPVKPVARVLSEIQEQGDAVIGLMVRIVEGPASGDDSLVTTANGSIKTLARALADLEATYTAAPVLNRIDAVLDAANRIDAALLEASASASSANAAAQSAQTNAAPISAALAACEAAASTASEAAQTATNSAQTAQSVLEALADLNLTQGDLGKVHALVEESLLLNLQIL